MLILFCFTCLLGAFNIQATEQELGSQHVDDVSQKDTDIKNLWKVILNAYYSIKGVRNETTDKLVESFFEHEFQSYPDEVYPAFKEIFEHISKSNDRIWSFYESILYLYHNVGAADRIYETVLNRLAHGQLLKESEEQDIDDTYVLEYAVSEDSSNVQKRSGIACKEESVLDYEEPCEDCGVPPLQVGSIRAIPGEHFPNYDEIPLTSFTCEGKHIPGFYADLETGCQVFHVCYPHRRESFLCPIGTTFNQAILACDYWYSSNCSLAPLYFISGELALDEFFTEGKETFVDQLLEQQGTLDTTLTEIHEPVSYPTREPEKKSSKPKSPKIKITLPNIDWSLMIKFLPVKSKITECPDFCETTKTAYPTGSRTAEPVDESLSFVIPNEDTLHPKEDEYNDFLHPVTPPVWPEEHEYSPSTTAQPVVTPVRPKENKYPTKPVETPAPPKKIEHGDKTEKSEILLDILKAAKLLTRDAEGFLTKILQKKHRAAITKKPTETRRYQTKKPKPFSEINQRFVVKPAKARPHLPRVKVVSSKPLKPSKQIPKSKKHVAFRKPEPAKIVREGMKVLSHLFD